MSLFDFFTGQISLKIWTGCVLIAIVNALPGSFSFLRKRALLGDAISHSVLPGVCVAFIFFHTKSLLFLSLGALASGLLCIFTNEWLAKQKRIKPETAIAITLSFYFGIGAVLLTYIQQLPGGHQSGLNHFLFGKAAAITYSDIYATIAILGIQLLVIILFYEDLKTLAFQREFAAISGLKTKVLTFFLSIITVLGIVAGILAAGVVLVSALLIVPALTALPFCQSLLKFMFLAVVVAIVGATLGAYASYIAPRMPTGPWIVVFYTLLFVLTRGIRYGIIKIRKRYFKSYVH